MPAFEIHVFSPSMTMESPSDRAVVCMADTSDPAPVSEIANAAIDAPVATPGRYFCFKASDPKIDLLRDKIDCVEDPQFTRDYHDPEKRSIANALTVEFKDGKRLAETVVEYPIGHKRRRKEGMPILVEKFKTNLARRFPPKQQKAILELCMDAEKLAATPVDEFVDLFVI